MTDRKTSAAGARPRNARRLALVALLVVPLCVVAGWLAWRAAETRVAWRQARPLPPDFSAASAGCRQHAEAADARVRAYPPDVPALAELAQLYHANGFLREAEQAYHGLLRFDPTNARWPHLLGTLLAGYGRLDEALPLLQHAVALAPGYAPVRLRLADSLLKAGRVDEAEQAYRALLALSPNDGYARLGLARIDLARERLTAAREELSRAAAADPTFFGAQSLLASVFEQLGDDEAAANARAKANQAGRFRDAPDPWVAGLMDFCYDVYRLQVAAATAKSTGDTAGAIPLLQRALSLAPDDASTLRQLGSCLLEQRDFQQARPLLQHAAEVAPADSASWTQLAAYYRATGNADRARETLETGLGRSKDTGPIQAELGALLVNLHRVDEAIPHLQEAIRLSPEKPDIARDLVVTLFESGRSEQAAAVLTAALQRNPAYAPLLAQGARLRILQQDATGAADLMRRAEHAGASPGELARLAAEYQRQFGRSPP